MLIPKWKGTHSLNVVGNAAVHAQLVCRRQDSGVELQCLGPCIIERVAESAEEHGHLVSGCVCCYEGGVRAPDIAQATQMHAV